MRNATRALIGILLVMAAAMPASASVSSEKMREYARRLTRMRAELETKQTKLNSEYLRLKQDRDAIAEKHNAIAKDLRDGAVFVYNHRTCQTEAWPRERVRAYARRKAQSVSPEQFEAWKQQIQRYHDAKRSSYLKTELPSLKRQYKRTVERMRDIERQLQDVKRKLQEIERRQRVLRQDQIRRCNIVGTWRSPHGALIRFSRQGNTYVGRLVQPTPHQKKVGFRAGEVVVWLKRVGEGMYKGTETWRWEDRRPSEKRPLELTVDITGDKMGGSGSWVRVR